MAPTTIELPPPLTPDAGSVHGHFVDDKGSASCMTNFPTSSSTTVSISNASDTVLQSRAEEIADRFADSMNGVQHWLTITPIVESDGEVELIIDIRGHFAAHAQEATPLALCAALATFFDSLATQARHATESVLGDLESATRSC